MRHYFQLRLRSLRLEFLFVFAFLGCDFPSRYAEIVPVPHFQLHLSYVMQNFLPPCLLFIYDRFPRVSGA